MVEFLLSSGEKFYSQIKIRLNLKRHSRVNTLASKCTYTEINERACSISVILKEVGLSLQKMTLQSGVSDDFFMMLKRIQ